MYIVLENNKEHKFNKYPELINNFQDKIPRDKIAYIQLKLRTDGIIEYKDLLIERINKN